MTERFSQSARKAIKAARAEARRLNSEFIGTEHLLLGLLLVEQGTGIKVLRDLNADLKRIRQEIEKLITPSTSPTVTLGQLPFSPRAKRVIEFTGEAASELHHFVIGTEHLLIGLVMESEGIAAQVLSNLGVRLDDVRARVVLGTGQGPGGPAGELEFPCTAEGRRILELAAEAARNDGQSEVGAGHLLLGILQAPDTAVRRALADLGINADVLHDGVRRQLRFPHRGAAD